MRNASLVRAPMAHAVAQQAMNLPGRDFHRPLNAHSAPSTLPEINRQGYRPTTHCAHCLGKPNATTSCRDLRLPTRDAAITTASTFASKLEPHCALLVCVFVFFVGRHLAAPVAYCAVLGRSDLHFRHWGIVRDKEIIIGRDLC